MKNTLKGFVTGAIIFLLIVGAFIVGNSLNLNVASALGFSSNSHSAEPIPETEPFFLYLSLEKFRIAQQLHTTLHPGQMCYQTLDS